MLICPPRIPSYPLSRHQKFPIECSCEALGRAQLICEHGVELGQGPCWQEVVKAISVAHNRKRQEACVGPKHLLQNNIRLSPRWSQLSQIER